MSVEQSLKLVSKGDIAVIEWDLVGAKVNTLSSSIMNRLKDIIDELSNSSFKVVVLISRKKNIFIAGADIDEIKNLKTTEEYMAALDPAHDIFNAIEDLSIPTIVAIHGACMGGGTEMSLACDYRIASDDKSTKIGLPEIKLGIIPGFGGCLRLPRVIGLQAALDIILAGKSIPAKKALKIGLVDEVVPKEILEQRAMALAQDIINGKKGKRKKVFKPKGVMNGFLESFIGRPIVFSQAKKMLIKQTKGYYPAPLAALEVVRETYGYRNRTQAIEVEKKAFCKVATTDISKHLINLFFMLEFVKKQTGVDDTSVKPIDVKSMGVLGAGVMGGGIAQVGADKGIDVRMKDITNEALAIGYKQAYDVWNKKVKHRRLTRSEMNNKMNHITSSLDYSGFRTLDVVVEAIVEDMSIKQAVVGEAVKHCKESCIIATNTSSLSVTEMSSKHPNPKNFVGMHFFNPVNKMPLVEVIRGEQTSDIATATIFDLAKKMGKTPVVVKDGPGFLVNRLLLPWMSEALFLLEGGMSVETTDRYYTHKFGLPMGPFRLLDEVGLDVATKVFKIFRDSLGERIQISDLSTRIDLKKRLGKKNGLGFYKYDEKGREIEVDQTIYDELGLKSPTDPYDETECVQRGIFQMINEASRALLEDRIVADPQSLDLAMIMGTGFPPFRGGLMRYADSIGLEKIVQELEAYATKYGIRFQPAPSLVNLSKSHGTFYEKNMK